MERRIIITGANGQLGRDINRVLNERRDMTIINTSLSESTAYCPIKMDITNQVAVMNLIQDIKPEIIINCSAYTQVDLCESEQEKAYKINALGPKNLAIAAEAMEAKLIHISTDYVFDGESNKPYTEDDIPSPINYYGTTKFEGEKFVQNLCEKHFIIRTSWLYGEGKNFVKTMLSTGEEQNIIKVVNDQYGCPTSAAELARMICYIMETNLYGIYHGVCEGKTTWYDFALEIFRIMGKEVAVEPISSDDYRTVAKRPKYSVLEDKKLHDMGYFMQNWQDALSEYIHNL